MNECVSIVVPVYNVEKYLKRCLNSLINQTYSKLEIILVDDGSKDNSIAICKEYEKKDQRIHVFQKENEGLGLTRNFGIKKATGTYITFVDSDDYLVLDAIEIMLRRALEMQADVVIANFFYGGAVQRIMLPERLYQDKEIRDTLVVHMMGNLANISDSLPYTATAKLFRRELFEVYNVQFPSERELIWEDLAFSVEIFPLCNRVYITHYPVYHYCFNENSLTHIYKPDKINLVMILYRYMVSKIKEIDLPIEAKKRLNTNFIGHIRTCIKLEVFYGKQNGYANAKKHVQYICNRDDVQKIIRDYNKEDYSMIQRIYNFFVEHKLVVGVYLLTWIQNKKKRIE